MKRFSCNDSFNALLYPSQGEMMKANENGGYSREFQAMLDGLDEEDSIEESGQSSSDKKRRLSNHQVKSLEKIFEVDNKLDPERKIKLAHDLGLQPRQVAIWFQNRRARWKTKQLERDYNILMNNYDTLKLNFQKMEQEKENLAAQLKELKDKFSESSEKTETNEFHTKEKALFWGSHNNGMDSSYSIELCGEPEPEPEPAKTNHELYQSLNLDPTNGFMDLKDGSSDSDSSGVLNEDNTNLIHDQLLISPPTFTSPRFDLSSLNYSQFLDSRSVLTKGYQQEQMVKMEEQCLVTSSDESCNIFSVDQAPTLCWYFPEQRN